MANDCNYCNNIIVKQSCDRCLEEPEAKCVRLIDCDGETPITLQDWFNTMCIGKYTINAVCYEVVSYGTILKVNVTPNFTYSTPNHVTLFAKYDGGDNTVTTDEIKFPIKDSALIASITAGTPFDIQFLLSNISDIPSWDDDGTTTLTLQLIDNKGNYSEEFDIETSINECDE